MYRFVGKPGKMYVLEPEEVVMKLNFRCKEGTVEEGSFSCGKTPKEAKKNYEKQQKEKTKPVSTIKPDVKQPTFDAKDIVSRITSGGKISKEEYNFILPYINGSKKPESAPAKQPAPTPSNSVTKKTESEKKQVPAKKTTEKVREKDTSKEKSKSDVSIPSVEIKPGGGLSKIRDEIKRAGGAAKFFETADTHAKGQEERKPIDSEQMARIVSLYTNKDTFKKPYKEENGVKWYEQKNDGVSIVVAKVGKKIAAYGIKAADSDDPEHPYTTIVAATDFAGKGYGKQAMLEFYDKNPDMIRKTGGLTPMGKKAYLKTLKTIAGED